MKTGDAMRAFALTEALATIDSDWWAKEMASDKVGESWEYRGLRIGVADLGFGKNGDFDCCNVHGWADIDKATGQKLMAAMREIIVAELRALGIEDA